MAGFLHPKPIGQYRYGVDALDGDIENLTFADPVPPAYRWPLGNYTPREIYGGGAPVSPINMPTKLRLTRRLRKLIDFDNAGHMYMVTRRFIDIVENFQKDIQYFPVDCVWSDGSFAGKLYIFFTTVLLDAVNREKTTATWKQILPERGVWRPKYEEYETFVFDKARLGDTHLWVDPNMPTNGALMTDTLRRALQDANVESFNESGPFEEL